MMTRAKSPWLLGPLFAGLLLGVAACERRPVPVTAPAGNPAEDISGRPPLFEDVTGESGIAFTYRNGEEANHYSILESVGGGVALLDYDGDGLLDIFLTGGGAFDGPNKKHIQGYPSRLYKNLGNGKFRDVTAEAGLDQPLFYTHGCAVA